MTRKDVMLKFNQIGDSFEYIKIELINGSSIFFIIMIWYVSVKKVL